MEAQSTLSGVVPVEKITQSFFGDAITDGRFLSSDYAGIDPMS